MNEYMKKLPEPFPPGIRIRDVNPGIRLYGLRFVKDQTPIEYVAEFMMVLFSTKTIGDKSFEDPLPEITLLRNWSSGEHLYYSSVPIRLLLKLFAFCSKTSIDKRHEVHEQQYKNLLDLLDKRIKVGFGSKTEIIDSLEELFAGLLGAGAERNWCARTFFPLAECLLSQEVISNDKETKKRAAEKINRGDTLTWIETIEHMNTFYSLSSQKFLARGGEMLYLQLCNLFSQSQEKIDKWTYNIGLQEYFDISKLRRSLNNKLISLRKSQLSGLEKLAYYIEQFDEQTWSKLQNMEKQKVLKCEWCPQETWPETLFFAIELRNILSASLDPVERVEHLKYVCSLQVLRTLCAQSLRYVCDYKSNYKFAKAPLGYLWIMTSVEASRALKVPAASNLIRMTDIIYNSLRHPELINWTITSQKIPRTTFEDLYKEADDAYGHSLFLSLGKSMELIIPRKGSGARFIANDKLVRYLVSSLLRPGEQIEYRDFLKRMYMHYGMAIEGDELLEAIEWSGHPRPTSSTPNQNDWFQDLLRKGGFLIELSDACSIVQNPFSQV